MSLPDLPTLVVVSGPPGAGKTTLAHAIARAVGCPAICCLAIGTPVTVGYRLDDEYRPVAARMSARDGSWTEIETADTYPRALTQAGPTRLWEAVEYAFQRWHANDRPAWDRLGLTVTTDDQRVWLDTPDGPILGHLPTS